MKKETKSNKEIKLTAAVYAHRPWVVKYVKKTGKLPKNIPFAGDNIGVRVIIETRGTDITLTADEQLVYDAIVKEKRLPGGSVILI
jgi:hypothetical protein